MSEEKNKKWYNTDASDDPPQNPPVLREDYEKEIAEKYFQIVDDTKYLDIIAALRNDDEKFLDANIETYRAVRGCFYDDNIHITLSYLADFVEEVLRKLSKTTIRQVAADCNIPIVMTKEGLEIGGES